MIYQQSNFKNAARLAGTLAKNGATIARFIRVGGIWFIETRGAN